MSDARSPDWDKNGKYLYFTASTDLGLASAGANMSAMGHPVTRAVYLAVLGKDLPSPLALESDEEKDDAKDKDPAKKSDGETKVAEAEKPADAAASETKPEPKPAADTAKKKEKEAVKVVIDFEGRAQSGLDRGQPPQGRRTQRRQARLRLRARHVDAGLHQFQPLLLRPGRPAGRGDRRALQRRRFARRQHRRLPAPRIAIFDLNGKWEVENVGIGPDIEVEHDPKLVRAGRDPQLEKAVEVVLEALKKNPPPNYPVPAYLKHPPRWPAR